MTPLRQQMIDALQLNGKSEPTQEAYVRKVRLLSQYFGKSPDLLSEEELQKTFLHRKNGNGLSAGSMRIGYRGNRFFYQRVLHRDWTTLALIRARTERRLPAVLSVEEVHRLLDAVGTLHNRAYLTAVTSCGLRLHEGLFLQVSDIDSHRMMIHVHRGKGAKACPRIGSGASSGSDPGTARPGSPPAPISMCRSWPSRPSTAKNSRTRWKKPASWTRSTPRSGRSTGSSTARPSETAPLR